VTQLALAWLARKRSATTRTAYARDLGITAGSRPSRASSWLDWCAQPLTCEDSVELRGFERRTPSMRTQRTTGQQPQVLVFVLVSGLRRLMVTASEAA
jgi:hypothetical protein